MDWARSISLRVLHAPATSTGTPVAHFVTHFFSFRKGTGFRAGRISFRQEEKIKLPAGRRGIGKARAEMLHVGSWTDVLVRRRIVLSFFFTLIFLTGPDNKSCVVFGSVCVTFRFAGGQRTGRPIFTERFQLDAEPIFKLKKLKRKFELKKYKETDGRAKKTDLFCWC